MKKHFLIFSTLFCFISANFLHAACTSSESQIIINIIPDTWPTETTWDIKQGLELLLLQAILLAILYVFHQTVV